MAIKTKNILEANQTRDKVYRMAAVQGFKDLLKEAKKKSAWRGKGAFLTIGDASSGFVFAIIMEEIDTRFNDLVFMIHEIGSYRGGSYSRNVFPQIGGGSDIIDLRIISKKLMTYLIANPKDKSSVVAKAIQDNRDVIVHELQHYLSINKRQNNQGDKAAFKAGTKEYYNSSEEMNAYYQQGADIMEQMIKDAIRDPDYANIVRRHIPSSYQDFIKAIFNKSTSNRIWYSTWLDNLTPKNRKKFVIRLAPLHKKLAKKI